MADERSAVPKFQVDDMGQRLTKAGKCFVFSEGEKVEEQY
jgi:hypothetical protein